MELVGKNICPVCGKEFIEVKGNCELNKDREFYGGRVSFFQNVTCNCGAKYRLCIEQCIDNYRIIDMIILARGKAIENIVGENEEKTETVVTVNNPEVETPEKIFTNAEYIKNPNENKETKVEDYKEESKPVIIRGYEVKNYNALKKSLMILPKKELQQMLRKRHMKFDKALCRKEQLVEKLIKHDPQGKTLNKYILPEFENEGT